MMASANAVEADAVAWLVRALGGEDAAAYTRQLTDHEVGLVEEFLTSYTSNPAALDTSLAAHNGDPVAALGVEVDADTAAIIESLSVGIRR